MRITRKQRVLDYLMARPNQWVDGPELASPSVGGSEGLRRKRELEAEGHVIEERRHPDRRRAVHQYRVVTDRVSPLKAPDPKIFVHSHYRSVPGGNMSYESLFWQSFNPTFGPWYRLKGIRNSLTVDLEWKGRSVEVVVQPDMDRARWFWSVRWAAYRPRMKRDAAGNEVRDPKRKPIKEKRLHGTAPTEDEAKAKAIEVFHAGRPAEQAEEDQAQLL
mgnify:CR=1 FL=1